METTNIKGKETPTYQGVLDEAHKNGLVSIKTYLIQIPSQDNHYMAIVKAKVTMKNDMKRTFEAYGDATPKNVNSMIAPHIVRMAETRAKGRALRDAINVGSALREEMS